MVAQVKSLQNSQDKATAKTMYKFKIHAYPFSRQNLFVIGILFIKW